MPNMRQLKTKKALRNSYNFFHPFSEKYEVDFKRFLASLNILSRHLSFEGKNFLDIGSGIGLMAMVLKNLGAEAAGVDNFIFPSEKNNYYTVSDFGKLQAIWEKAGIKIFKSDIVNSSLPFPNEAFDAVVCEATIEHLTESPRELFSEARRVLKKDGLFLVSTPNLANLLRRLRFLLGRSPHWDLREFFEAGRNFKGHRREYTLKELALMLEWSSFDVIFKGGKIVFFNPKRFLNFKKIPSQLCSLISYVLPDCRDMIYALGRKK